MDYRRNNRVKYERVNDYYLMINPDTGIINVINETAFDIWSSSNESNLHEIGNKIKENYAVAIDEHDFLIEIDSILQQMINSGLILTE